MKTGVALRGPAGPPSSGTARKWRRQLDSESIADIKSITVMPSSMSRRNFHGTDIYVLDRVMFDAVGGAHFSGMFRGSKPPDTFTMVYSFKED